MFHEYPDILMINDLCEILSIGKNAASTLLGSGAIKGFRQNRIWKVPKIAVVEYVLKSSGMNMKNYNC